MVWKTTLVILFSFISIFEAKAQKSNAFELNEYLSDNSNNKTSLNLKSRIASSTPLQVLAYDLVPTVFIENGKIKFSAESTPIKAEVSINSFQTLTNPSILFNSIELLVIKFDSEDQLRSALDFSKINGFSTLKYVYFLCPFNCAKSQIENIAQNLPSGVTLLYSASIPE